MATTERYRRCYRLQCDGCGVTTPEYVWQWDALAQAKEAGWSLGGKEGDLCSFCVKARDDEEAYRDYRDEQDDKAAVHAGIG